MVLLGQGEFGSLAFYRACLQFIVRQSLSTGSACHITKFQFYKPSISHFSTYIFGGFHIFPNRDGACRRLLLLFCVSVRLLHDIWAAFYDKTLFYGERPKFDNVAIFMLSYFTKGGALRQLGLTWYKRLMLINAKTNTPITEGSCCFRFCIFGRKERRNGWKIKTQKKRKELKWTKN